MSTYAYVAFDVKGAETRGLLAVADRSEALRRIKEMGLFPTRLIEEKEQLQPKSRGIPARKRRTWHREQLKPALLAVFTRQLATLIDAGMPLVRSLRTLEQQAESRVLKQIIGDLALSIESGGSFAEAVAAHPGVFNRLYLNMVKAGEMGGALETTLRRLAEFVEKAQRIKGRVKAALFYPCAVLVVAGAILVVLMTFVVPRFQAIFQDLLQGAPLPAFTLFIFRLSELARHHLWEGLGGIAAVIVALALARRTTAGQWGLDYFKLSLPVLGPLFRKVAISRFSRTLGTLAASGVPILQALTIVKETAGNLLYARVIERVHENVKQGEPLAPTLKASGLFPVMVAGMVDVGEQTGALPEMLAKVADTYDEEVDNAASALTSLLEPIMIVFLAVVVGSIVIAMFLPLITVIGGFSESGPGPAE